MNGLSRYFLVILVFLPAAGALLLTAAKGFLSGRRIALGATLLTFALSAALPVLYDRSPRSGPAEYAARDAEHSGGVVQFVIRPRRDSAQGAPAILGVDGLSLPLVLLCTLLFPLACMASAGEAPMGRRDFAHLLLLESAALGTFLSLDLRAFLGFFGLVTIPLYFLLGSGKQPRNKYAALKFCVLMLGGIFALAIAVIGVHAHANSWNVVALPAIMRNLTAHRSLADRGLLFFIPLMVAFVARMAIFPLHAWLPDAQAEAKTSLNMILGACVLSTGAYGILRVAYPLFPEAARILWMPIAAIGAIGISYGALCALAQIDPRRLLAYAWVSHGGWILLGAAVLNPSGAQGAWYILIAQGVTLSMLFSLFGTLADRAGHWDLLRLGSAAGQMPILRGLCILGFFSNMGLPLLGGFVGNFLVLLGVFTSAGSGSTADTGSHAALARAYPLALFACLGGVLTVGYSLRALRLIMAGNQKAEQRTVRDLSGREIALLAPQAVLIVLLGVLPTPLALAISRTTLETLPLRIPHFTLAPSAIRGMYAAMSNASVAIVDTLNSLLEAEDTSIFRFVGEGSPFLASASPDVRHSLEEMTRHLKQHAKELGRLIENLGAAPAPKIRPNSDEQYLAHLSLRFLLPKLVDAKELMIQRHENALRAVGANPEVTQVLDRHIGQMRADLAVLRTTADEVIRGKGNAVVSGKA